MLRLAQSPATNRGAMRFLLRLFRWRRRRPRLHAIDEAEAYARSYGERSEEIVSVAAVLPEAPPTPPPTPPSPPSGPAVQRAGPGRLTDAALRSAFLARIAARSGRRT
jgi:hypothetical protein